MNFLSVFFLVFLLAILSVVLISIKRARENGTKVSQEFFDVCLFNRQSLKKKKNKQKIIELLKKRGEISNEEIRKETGVLRSTVVNYMDELEKDGKVEQIGKTGQEVVYRLK